MDQLFGKIKNELLEKWSNKKSYTKCKPQFFLLLDSTIHIKLLSQIAIQVYGYLLSLFVLNHRAVGNSSWISISLWTTLSGTQKGKMAFS